MEYIAQFLTTARFYIVRTAKQLVAVFSSSSQTARIVASSALFFMIVAYVVTSAPASFPTQSIITIEKGASLEAVAHSFKEANVIRSALLLRLIVAFSGNANNVIAGDYFFQYRTNAISIAYSITHGQFGLKPVIVTVPEGASLIDIAELFSEHFPKFDPQEFLILAQGKEGYLFPDTYYFFPNDDALTIFSILEDTFSEKVSVFERDFEEASHPREDIITMASIIEREARTSESRRVISGILWKRLEIGMPLQVDVTFKYINGKSTFYLTKDDLTIDSPYNTYKYAGLPPGPIGNPSIDAIDASLHPITTPYLYFLADKTGAVHYSETFEEHKEKKQRYLN